jgi:cytochrome P450
VRSASLVAEAPGALPGLGHALPLLRDPLRFLQSLPSCGDLVEIRIGPIRALVVCDAGLTHQLLLEDRTFDKAGLMWDRGREIFGNGLTSSPHRDHRKRRRMLQPLFHPSRFPGYTDAMLQEVTAVMETWRDGQTLDVFSETMKIGSRITLVLILGSTLPPATLTKMTDYLTTVVTNFYQWMFLRPPLDRVPLPSNRRYNHAFTSLRTMLSHLIEERRACQTDRTDLLSLLLATPRTAEDSVGADQLLPDTEIIDHVITFFAAGVESTAATIAWAMDLLARHPGIQQRMDAEVDALPSGPVQFNDLPALALTQRVITETLRLYPPGWLFTRKTTHDSRLGPHSIAAETTLIYSSYLIHHRPDLYADPDRFDPDRWANQNFPRHAFIPFGGGARKCIGESFALIEATLTLATITANWNLHPLSLHPPRAKVGLSLRPHRFPLRLVSRHRRERVCPPNG